jgi:G3E family GTPase
MDLDEQRPVTILSGGLGAGKTTLVNQLLTEGGQQYDIAVLVNDVGEINIDADLIESGSELSMGDGVTELSNGCICCGLQDELDRELVRLAMETSYDYLVIEPSGISDPVPIAQRFVRPARASALYDLDTIATVVDAAQFHRAFVDGRAVTPTDEGTRPLSELLAEQVEFCDVVVLNKCDLVSDPEREAVEDVLETLHPGVDIFRTTAGAVDPETVLGTGKFDVAEAKAAARWKQELTGDHEQTDAHGHAHEDTDEHDDHGHDEHHDHRHPPEEFGVDSFVFERQRPFHPERFAEWLRSFPEAVVRAKGHLWVAGRQRYALDLSQAGAEIHVTVNGRWVASLPEGQQESYRERRPTINWDDEWGDRETALVFIGSGMDHTAIVDSLDDCLVDDEEWDLGWEAVENRFPGRRGESQPPTEQRLVIQRRE